MECLLTIRTSPHLTPGLHKPRHGATTIILAFGRWRQKNQKCEVTVGYTVSSRAAWITKDTVSKISQKKKKNRQNECTSFFFFPLGVLRPGLFNVVSAVLELHLPGPPEGCSCIWIFLKATAQTFSLKLKNSKTQLYALSRSTLTIHKLSCIYRLQSPHTIINDT